jgi:DNA uptake protein ComE-like DNA-binding protein
MASHHPQLGVTPGLMIVFNGKSKLRTENNKTDYTLRKHLFILFFLFTCFSFCHAQTTTSETEQQLENLTDADQTETEDDSYLQQMQHYLKNPININSATVDELRDLKIISDLQIDNLIVYRRLFGNLISVYELQAVPSWDLNTIKRILPLITVANALLFKEEFSTRFRGGEHSFW